VGNLIFMAILLPGSSCWHLMRIIQPGQYRTNTGL
jgi:hypothetical protein